MVAARDVKEGEKIIGEDPVLVRSLSRKEAAGKPSLKEQFNDLSQDMQAKILQLHDENPDGSEGEKIERIFEGNAIEDGRFQCTALYPTIPRINHSCVPNAVWSWVDGHSLLKEVRAIRNISTGEEITANYIDSYEATFASCEDRQTRLQYWNFVCSCEVCSSPLEERARNDEVRRTISLQHELIPRYMEGWNVERAMVAARTKLDLMLSLELEMKTTLPSALLELWEMARIAQEQGGCSVTENCDSLLQQAEDLAKKLGG